MKKSLIYLDYAATTPVDPRVVKTMTPFWQKKFGNPSSLHFFGQEAREALDQAREQVAQFLRADFSEIIFTSCATESINLAHKGLLEAKLREFSNSNLQFPKKFHLITSSIEHSAVLETCRHLEKLGWLKVDYLKVSPTGLISLSDLKAALRPETILISIGFVNNEVGTVQPIEEIGRWLNSINAQREKENLGKIYFHSDVTQAVGHFKIDVNQLGLDLASFSGHKFYAPKGIGVLYKRSGTPMVRQQDGGGQENYQRSGTENLSFIVGLAKGLEIIEKEGEKESRRIGQLSQKLIKGLLKVEGVNLVGDPQKRAPHIVSVLIDGVEGEAVLLALSDFGVAVSTGSACASGELEPSHVLLAMNIPAAKAHSSIRFSLGRWTTEEQIDYVINVFPKVVEKLRKIGKGVEI